MDQSQVGISATAPCSRVTLGDVQRAEVVDHADQRPHREEDEAQVEVGRGLERHVGRHQDVALLLHDGHVRHHRPDEHHQESGPGQPLREQAAVQEHGAREVEDRNLEVQDPEDQHVDAVERQHAVVPGRVEQVDGRPARQPEQDRADAADQQEHHRDHGVPLDEALRGQTYG
jgi:hypothetical protein